MKTGWPGGGRATTGSTWGPRGGRGAEVLVGVVGVGVVEVAVGVVEVVAGVDEVGAEVGEVGAGVGELGAGVDEVGAGVGGRVGVGVVGASEVG